MVTPIIVLAQGESRIQWKTWAELESALAQNPRPVLLFFHADWCEYCKKIERVVFTKPDVIDKINKNYYAVSMDVERTDTITFDGMIFKNKQALTQRNGVHELALLLGSRDGKDYSLPVTILLHKDFTIRERIFEYYTSKQLLTYL
jgi:thioredoxin-related protein